MKPCTGCRRSAPVTWNVDGTTANLCARCIYRALREAEQLWVAERMRRLFGR